MKIEITISRKGVMGITEGISVTIAQHNGGTPSFDQLWASDSEAPKLDIYYREGISALERRLEKWLEKSSAQFDLQATGDDYTLRLDVNRSWPTRLDGLLKNKVQDYLVHTVTAGWLNDFEGVSVKQDYQAMAAQDLDDIVYIVGLKSFGFAEKERAEESDKDAESDGSAQGRCTDEEKEEETKTGVAEERTNDADKADNPYTVEAGERKADEESTEASAHQPHTERKEDADKVDNPYTVEAGERKADEESTETSAQQLHTERKEDADKADNPYTVEVGERKADTTKDASSYSEKGDERHSKNDNENTDERNGVAAGGRNADDDTVDIRHDYTDWSGTSALIWETDFETS